jgi:hypothetical protein
MARTFFGAMLIVWFGLASAQEAPKPAPEAKPAPPAQEPAKPAASAERILTIEKSTAPPKCEIKPVMTDDELRACGARIPK